MERGPMERRPMDLPNYLLTDNYSATMNTVTEVRPAYELEPKMATGLNAVTRVP